MDGLVRFMKRTALFTGLGLLLCCNSGCSYKLLHGMFWTQTVNYVKFWMLSPQVPDFEHTCPEGNFGGCTFTDMVEIEVFGE